MAPTKAKEELRDGTTYRLLPDWVQEPFRRFLDWAHEADSVLHVSMHGISTVQNLPRVTQALALADSFKEPEERMAADEHERRLDLATREAEVASKEVAGDFPFLHSQAVIALWGALEDLVFVFIAAWLKNVDEALQVAQVRRIKVPLADYLLRTEDERFELLAQSLEETVGGSQRFGVNRFEELLRPLGLAGDVSSDVSRRLYAMQQLRHVFVHRRGIADRRFCEACPWLGVSPGDPVLVTHQLYLEFRDATQDYVLTLINRVRLRFDLSAYVGGQGSMESSEEQFEDQTRPAEQQQL